MIKVNKDNVEIKGNIIQIMAEMTTLIIKIKTGVLTSEEQSQLIDLLLLDCVRADDEIDKLVIYYDYTRKEFGVTCTWVCKYLGEIYFKNEADAKYIIDNFKEELLEYWL